MAPESKWSRDLRVHNAADRDAQAQYAEALQAIDVEGAAVKAFAEHKGLSPNNAGVRVFRAREALKKRVMESCGTCAEHGCRNCTCQTSC